MLRCTSAASWLTIATRVPASTNGPGNVGVLPERRRSDREHDVVRRQRLPQPRPVGGEVAGEEPVVLRKAGPAAEGLLPDGAPEPLGESDERLPGLGVVGAGPDDERRARRAVEEARRAARRPRGPLLAARTTTAAASPCSCVRLRLGVPVVHRHDHEGRAASRSPPRDRRGRSAPGTSCAWTGWSTQTGYSPARPCSLPARNGSAARWRRSCWPTTTTSGARLTRAVASAPTAFPRPGRGVQDRERRLARPIAQPVAMPTTELSCSPSTNRRSSGRSASSEISVEPGFAKSVVSPRRRQTSNVASRTVSQPSRRHPTDHLERERLGLLPRGHPLPLGPELDLADAAEVAAVARGLGASERRRRLLVDGLVVDVTMPDSSWAATAAARSRLPDWTAADEPVLGGVRQLDASSSVLKVVTAATGPKISSLKAAISGVTSRRTVGGKNRPSRVPPTSAVAPAATVSSTIRCTRAICFSLMSGPSATCPDRRVPDREMPSALGERCEVLLDDRLVHEVPADREADLALVQERAPRAGGRCGLDVGVVEHDQRAVAAELQHDALQRAARRLADQAPGLGRAGERDHPHARILDERLPDLGAAAEHVQHTRSAGLPPRRCARSARRPLTGVLRSPLSTAALPSTSAGPSERIASTSGKFQGVITPTTPSGTPACGRGPARDRRRQLLLELIR